MIETSSVVRALTGCAEQSNILRLTREAQAARARAPMRTYASSRARERPVRVPGGLRGCAAMAWLGLYGFALERLRNRGAAGVRRARARPRAAQFLRLAPAYGGSLVERAPFALLPGPVGRRAARGLPDGGRCRACSRRPLLGVWLVARMRCARRPRLARAVALGVCVANPITLRALELGHPEELLGACLCVAAVLLAAGASTDATARCWRASCSASRSPTRSGRCSRSDRCCSRWRPRDGCAAWPPRAPSAAAVLAPLVARRHPAASWRARAPRPRRRERDLPAVAGCGGSSATTARSCTARSAPPSSGYRDRAQPGRARSAIR